MKRVLTALVLVPVAVYAALFSPWWGFFAVVLAAAVLCFREYSAITGMFAPFGYAAGLFILLAPESACLLIIVLIILAAMCLPLRGEALQSDILRSALLALGIVYIFGSWKIAILVHDSADTPGAFHVGVGRHLLMFGLLVNWIGDTGAYYIGKNFGRHKLAPAVSPGKTWEGAAAAAITAVIFGAIYLPLSIKGVPALAAGSVALAVNIAGQIGDLAESAIKRGAGVKDSGTILPGHGGLLDRLDSTMFALPVLYALLRFLPV